LRPQRTLLPQDSEAMEVQRVPQAIFCKARHHL